MGDGLKRCPKCANVLQLGHINGLTTFECPNSHGVGINILEAYRHLQRDELEAIWGGAKSAPLSKLASPITGKPMVEITFVADDDTEYGNAGLNAREMTIELDPENYFGWFSLEELRSMPTDKDGRGPAGPGLVGLDQIDRGEDPYDDFFDNLSEEDYKPTGRTSGHAANGLFTGLARRLRR